MVKLIRAAALLIASVVLPSCSPVDALNATVSTDGLSVRRDIAFQAGPRGKLDIYSPTGADGRLPLVVFVYGGSWNSGSKGDYTFAAAPIARAGAVVVVPDYRLVPEVLFPTFLQDNARAVAFARAHAAEWGADPRRIFLVGHSAGGYNVLMLAADPSYLAAVGMDNTALSGVISLAAPADFLPLDDPATIAAFGQATDLPATQPVDFASGLLPPLLLMHGADDRTVYPRNSQAMARMDGAATLKIYPGIGHIGIVTSLAPLFDGRAPVLADIMTFIAGHPAL